MSTSIRIAVDLRTLLHDFESGVSIYTKGMVRALSQLKGVDLDLYYQAAKRKPSIHKEFPAARYIPASNTAFHFRCLFGFPNLPKDYFDKRPDLIWIPDRRPFYQTEIPVVMSVHDMVPERYGSAHSFKSRLWHWLFPLKRFEVFSNGFIVPTESVLAELKTTLPCDFSYEGASLSRKMSGFDLDDFFLCIAPSDPRKRLDWILKAAKLRPDLNFVLAGIKAKDPRFRSIELGSHVRVLGSFSEEEKIWLLKNARALLALSEYEGFDLPILEAVQARCPVIMSDIPVHRELYSKGCFVKTHTEFMNSLEKATVPVPRKEFSWEMAAKRSLLFFRRVIVDKD